MTLVIDTVTVCTVDAAGTEHTSGYLASMRSRSENRIRTTIESASD